MATERKVQITIAAKDLASNVIGRVRADLVSFASSFASGQAIYDGAKSAIRGFYNAVKDGVDSSIAAQKSNAQLARALASVGASGTSAVDSTNAWAKALARQNAMSTGAVRDTATMIASIGRLSGDTLQRATRAAIDYAAAYGKDVKDAAIGVAKAAAGNYDALRENGIVLDQTIPKAKRFAEALRIIEETAGGAGKVQAGTTAGAIEALNVAITNLKRALADSLVDTSGGGYFTGLASAINAAADAMDRANKAAASPDGVMSIFRGFASQTNARPFGTGFATSSMLNALFGDPGLTSSAKQWAQSLDDIKGSIAYIYALAENAGTPQAVVAGQIERIATRAKQIYGTDTKKAIDDTIYSLGGLAIQYERAAIASAEKQNAVTASQARKAALEAEKEKQDALNEAIEKELKLFKDAPRFDAWDPAAASAWWANKRRDDERTKNADWLAMIDASLGPADEPLAWSKGGPLKGEEQASALREALAAQKEYLDGWSNISDVVGEISGSITNSLAAGIAAILSGTKSVGESLRGLFRSVLATVIEIIARMAAAKLIGGIIGAITGNPALAAIGSGLVSGPSTQGIGNVGVISPGYGALPMPEASASALKSAPAPVVNASVVTIATRRAQREITRLNNEYVTRRGGVVLATRLG